MLGRLLVACLCALVLSATVRAQSLNAPAFVAQITLPGSGETKLPRVIVSERTAHVAANVAQQDASYWSRPANGDAFAAPERIGPALGQPDYSTASLAAMPDGRLVYVWINQPERSIYARVRTPEGVWGPTYTVVRGSLFPVGVAVTATARELFVAWRDPDRPFVFSRSLDGGANWSSPSAISERAGVNNIALASDANGTLAAAYTQGSSDRLQVFAGLWNGRGFTTQRLTSHGGDYADPGVVVLPNGRVAVAWRGVADAGSGSGVFYAEQSADGGWPVAQLIAGKVIGPVGIAADEQGGQHLFWIGEAAGAGKLWYTHRVADNTWAAPIAAPAAGGAIFNASGAVGAGADGQVYAHAVSELFLGSRVLGRAYRFSTGTAVNSAPQARMLIEGGAARVRAGTLAVRLVAISGAPSELRWRWNATPAANDPSQPFAEQLEVPTPPAAGTNCNEHALYLELRGTGGQSEPVVARVTIDGAVQATLTALNAEGAPGYSRVPSAELLVDARTDCSGVAVISPLADAPVAVGEGAFRLTTALPAEEGPHSLALALADGLGNSGVFSTSVIYDATAPLVEPAGQLQISADAHANVLHTLTLHGAGYRDNLTTQPWGLAVALSRVPVSSDDAALSWRVYPLEQGPDNSQIRLSAADLLPREQLTPGSYHYLVRLVDAAGNRASTTASGSIVLDSLSYPQTYLPLLRR